MPRQYIPKITHSSSLVSLGLRYCIPVLFVPLEANLLLCLRRHALTSHLRHHG